MEEILLGAGSRVKHKDYGNGTVIQQKASGYLISFWDFGLKEIAYSYQEMEILEVYEPDEDLLSFREVETSLMRILSEYSDIQETVDIADKWKGGKLILQPGDLSQAAKEMPINTFFHKITMIRDRIRVLEQSVNSSKLEEVDKAKIQQYITRVYGSLTSFNVLFKFRSSYFVGEKSK